MATKATVRQQQCAALLCSFGAMPSGASALTGNFSQECGINIACGWRTGKLDHGSQGLAQWRLGRLDSYEAWARDKAGLTSDMSQDKLWATYGRLDLQCEFVMVEMKTDYPRLYEAICKGGSVSALTAEVCWQYERPSKMAANLVNRTTQALAVFNTIPGGASYAHTTDIRAAMDQVADTHAKTAAQGGAAVAAGGVLGAVGVLAHFVDTLAWYDWALIAFVAFIIVTGITAMIVGGSQAALVRNAKAQVDPKHLETPTDDPREVAQKIVEPHKDDPVADAKQAESEAIDKAMHPKSALEGREPIMSVHTPEKQP